MSKALSLVSIRYAKALLLLAGDGAKGSQYLSTFHSIEDLFALKEASDVLKSPVLPRSLKQALLELAYQRHEVDEQFKVFVMGVLDANRTECLPEIGRAFAALLMEKRNETKALVVSARPLSELLRGDIERSLENIFSKKFLLTMKVDEALLGGFVIHMENLLLDCSLLSKINTGLS